MAMPRIGTPISDRPVTSFSQEELWYLDRLIPRSAALTMSRAYRVTGPLDAGALAAAWSMVAGRHPLLGSCLAEVGGRPELRLAGAGRLQATLVDLEGEPEDLLRTELAAAALSLDDGPLARLIIVRVTAGDHRVVLRLHRAVADDRSAELLIGQLSRCYTALAAPGAGRPARAGGPAPAGRVADYARGQRAWAQTQDFRRLLDWWTDALTPAPAPVALPFDRCAELSFHGTGVRFSWDKATAEAVRALAGRAGVNPTRVMLAAFQALLYRYAGGQHGSGGRVAVGMPVPVRPAAFAEVVGPFDNLLVLCSDMTGAPTFAELLKRVSAAADGALAHRELPFSALAAALAPDRDPRRIPWCDAMLIGPARAAGGPPGGLRLTGTAVECLRLPPGPTLADLTLTVERVGSGIDGTLACRAAPPERGAAEGMVRQLRTLLMAAADDMDVPLDDLALEPRRPAPPPTAPPPCPPVTELIGRQARRHPDATAVEVQGSAMTYRELRVQAAMIANHLRRVGPVGPAPVVVRMAPGIRQIAVSVGVLEAGAPLVWFGAGDTGERGRAILAQLRPSCLLVDGPADGDELARWFRDELGGLVTDAAALPARTVGDGAGPQQAGPRQALSGKAYIAYTSGTTGRPKGVAHTHAAFAQFTTWLSAEFGLGPGSRVAQWVAPEHDPSLCEVFASLGCGATVCPVPERIRLNPERLADWLAAERITFFQTVPSLAREVLAVLDGDRGQRRLAALRWLVLMGEALPAELANGLRRSLPWVRLANVYGPTETIAATCHVITEPCHGTVPIGWPIPGRELLVLDDADRPCPPGVTGQIVIRSPWVADGYLAGGGGDPFAPAGDGEARCYRTGDLGRWRWDGLLEFRGRRDLQVKLGGTRIEVTEVESALARHDSVRECAVIPVTDADGLVSQLAAYVVPRTLPSGEPVGGPPQWRAHLAGQFGADLRLVSFHPLRQPLPRGISGKVDRRRLPGLPGRRSPAVPATAPAQSWAQPPALPPALPPAQPWAQPWAVPWAQLWSQLWAQPPALPPAQRRMARLWSELLEPGPFRGEDTFFAAGGHSLQLPQLINRIREQFGVAIPIAECVTHSSLASMSALVEAAVAAREPSADNEMRS